MENKKVTRSSAIARDRAMRLVSVEILPIATQQCRNYLYDTDLREIWHDYTKWVS